MNSEILQYSNGKPLRVLIVENKPLDAIAFFNTITAHGGIVVGVADRPDEALALAIAHRPDVALMSVRLRGGTSPLEIAANVDGMGTRMVFCAATPDRGTEERIRAFADAALLRKPGAEDELVAALRRSCA
jgi:two-component system, response regulator PdtaR